MKCVLIFAFDRCALQLADGSTSFMDAFGHMNDMPASTAQFADPS
jgi:hypothetical protein